MGFDPRDVVMRERFEAVVERMICELFVLAPNDVAT
jgi:hypothetical protein